MTKHTPGPWAFGYRKDDSPKAFIDPNFEQPWINIDPVPKNDLEILNGMGCICKVSGPDREANANLIAAAPDLLEVAKGILLLLDQDDQPYYSKIALLNAAERAIAKAEGK